MEVTLNNWMILTITNDPSIVKYGVDVSKKYRRSLDDARALVLEIETKYKNVKRKEVSNFEMYLEFETHFVQINIIDCSQTVDVRLSKQ